MKSNHMDVRISIYLKKKIFLQDYNMTVTTSNSFIKAFAKNTFLFCKFLIVINYVSNMIFCFNYNYPLSVEVVYSLRFLSK